MTAGIYLGFIGGLGVGEILVIGVVALLVFGRRLPEVARSVGKGVQEFRSGLSGVERDVQDSAYEALPGPTPLPMDAQPEMDAQPDLPDDIAVSSPPQTPPDSPSETSLA